MEHMQLAIDDMLSQILSAEIVILGDFNPHNANWLGSRTTYHAGRAAYDLAMANRLSQLVESPTRLQDVNNHNASLLDLRLTSHPEQYRIVFDAPLGSIEQCLVQSVMPVKRCNCATPTTRRIWHFKSADWDGKRTFYSSYP